MCLGVMFFMGGVVFLSCVIYVFCSFVISFVMYLFRYSYMHFVRCVCIVFGL